MPLSVYYDVMSQPARSVVIFLRVNGILFEARPVALRKGEQYGEEFKKINPLSKIPVIDDDGFKLSESITILKYLVRKHNLPEHWYSQQDLRKQARQDEYLDWHHLNMRLASTFLFREVFVAPALTGNPVNFKKVEELRKNFVKMLSDFEMYFLKDKKFITGDEISIADLFAVCELTELLACHEHGLYEKSPVVKSWVERVRQATNPHFDDVHGMIYRSQQRYKNHAAKL